MKTWVHAGPLQAVPDHVGHQQCEHFRSCVRLQFGVFWIYMFYRFSASSSPAAIISEYFCFCKQLSAVLSRLLCDCLTDLLIPLPGTNLLSGIKTESWGCREIKSGQIFWSTLYFACCWQIAVYLSQTFYSILNAFKPCALMSSNTFNPPAELQILEAIIRVEWRQNQWWQIQIGKGAWSVQGFEIKCLYSKIKSQPIWNFSHLKKAKYL